MRISLSLSLTSPRFLSSFSCIEMMSLREQWVDRHTFFFFLKHLFGFFLIYDKYDLQLSVTFFSEHSVHGRTYVHVRTCVHGRTDCVDMVVFFGPSCLT